MRMSNENRTTETGDLELSSEEFGLLIEVLNYQISRYKKLVDELEKNKDEIHKIEIYEQLKSKIESQANGVVKDFSKVEALRFRAALNEFNPSQMDDSTKEKIYKMQLYFDQIIAKVNKNR